MTITYHIINRIDSEPIVDITFPWDYRKAINGFYSGFWRKYKSVCASGQRLESTNVVLKFDRGKTKSDRLQISFPSGLKFNSPFDLNHKDFRIIDLHLEALKLARC